MTKYLQNNCVHKQLKLARTNLVITKRDLQKQKKKYMNNIKALEFKSKPTSILNFKAIYKEDIN